MTQLPEMYYWLDSGKQNNQRNYIEDKELTHKKDNLCQKEQYSEEHKG